ncbi:MAG TPA: OB-fold domain-containing protein [Solirubrobacteraceae bacterium]|jgi:hypothetical protein|nr:OB-fold domain-containing protein [Solirubrobacteraceae bacterium]
MAGDTTTVVHGQGLGSAPTERPIFRGVIELPYTLTAGKAAGTFLAELANKRIVGSRASADGPVLVPAQDFCPRTGDPAGELVVVGEGGTLEGFTETTKGLIGLIKLDGADTVMAHQLLDTSYEELSVGQRVSARWADEPKGEMLDLLGFAPAGEPNGAAGGVRALDAPADPIAELAYGLRLQYDHAYGPYYGRLFDELATSRRILGSRVPSTGKVLVPPREMDDVTFERTGEWVDVADTGVLKAFSVIHLQFVGQTREPPYVYAEIVLDGSNTRLIHAIGGIDPMQAPEKLRCGMRVRAVWNDDAAPTGTLEDIKHFEVIEG